MGDKLRIPFSDDLPVLIELARKLAPGTPLQAFKPQLGLTLSGVLPALLDDAYAPIPYAVWQQAHAPEDAPEFLPLLKATEGRRYGLWVDDLHEAPDFVVEAAPEDDGTRNPVYRVVARNLIELLRLELEIREAAEGMTPERNQLRDLILPFATADRLERGQEYLSTYARKAASVRERIVQATTPDGMGIRALGFDPHQMPAYAGDPAGLLEHAAHLAQAGLSGNALAVAKPLLAMTRGSALEGPTRAVLAEAYHGLKREAYAQYIGG